MIQTSRIALFASLLVVPAALATGQDTPPPLENGDIRSISVHPPEATAVEHFRLDDVTWGESLNGDGDPLGVVRFMYGPDTDPNADAATRRLEQEITFFDVQTRVLHTESLHPNARRMVWREVRASSGRTLLVDWSLHAGMRSTETVGGAIVRRDHDVSRGAFLPLYLVDLARARNTFDGSFRVFHPLSREIEDVYVETWSEGGNGAEARFVLSMTRLDGTLAGRYAFEGDRLVAFQWQRGGPVAREISRNEYDLWTVPDEDSVE